MQKISFLLFSLLLTTTGLSAQTTAIRCGQLFDGLRDAVLPGRVILVEGEQIIEIGDADIIPAGAEVIDLSEYTVMPGMIDAHVHPLIYGDDYQVNHLRQSSADKALYGLKVVQEFLSNGWTTLRIAGDADVHYAHLDIRDAVKAGLFMGPRIVGAGHYLSTTGGGGDINFLAPEQQLIADGLVVDGVAEVRKAVRREIKYGSDWIKLLVTGAFMTAGDNPQSVHFSEEEMAVAIEEANMRGVPVMAHAHSTEGIKQAVRAGVRSVEHGTFIDEEGMDLMIENGVYLIPTIYVGEYFMEEQKDSEALSKAVQLHLKYKPVYRRKYARAIEKGVKIGIGSDYVGFPVQYCAREFAELVGLGMSNFQALQAGTKVNAELLQMEDQIGTLEAGKMADIIALRGNPLEDISALERVVFVMAGGEVFKQPE